MFNGSERVSGNNAQGSDVITYGSASHSPTATQAERDHIPITAPSPTRLLATVGPLSGERLGFELLAALLLGAAGADRGAAAGAGRRSRPGDRATTRLQRAAAAALLVWMTMGIVLFSAQARLHPRYVEAFTPAVAAMLGIGVAWSARGRPRVAGGLDGGRAGRAAPSMPSALVYGTIGAWWVTVARRPARRSPRRSLTRWPCRPVGEPSCAAVHRWTARWSRC